MLTATLRQRRADLLDLPYLGGITFCRAYAKEADEWVEGLAEAAGRPDKVALLAVGGYGRGELSPYSDLDLVIVHAGRRDIAALAERIWYPIWDEGVRLDHSVRTPKELMKVAEEDLRVALGLLDARHLWGDRGVSEPIISAVRDRWAGDWGDRFLPELEAQMRQRHEQHGDLADLLEPDLKEAHGGLRDVNVLEAVRHAFPDVVRVANFQDVERARDVLLTARVALHRLAGRELDRLLLQEQDQVARVVNAEDADELMRAISGAARVVARTSDAAWRHRDRWRRRGSIPLGEPEGLEDGIEVFDGEVRLSSGAAVSEDVTLCLRLAAAAAERSMPIEFASLVRLSIEAPPIPEPWPEQLRYALDRLLAGPGVIAAVEALDSVDLFVRHLPEWRFVRSFHQRNAYHRFTADRHLLEATRHAQSLTDRVSRPDLLRFAALVHDIGKGHPGDHTERGIEIVQAMGPRLGLRDDDTATVVQLVRHHLLLADAATRRDLSDPATVRYVASALGDEQTLELLAALSIADGLATGPSAWGPWKAGLVEDLAERVRAALAGREHDGGRRVDPDVSIRDLDEGPHVRLEDDWLTIAVEDHPGVLSLITGALALLALDVRSADVTSRAGIAVDRFYCVPGPRGWPGEAAIASAIASAIADPARLHVRVAERSATYAPKARSARRAHPGAHALPAASDSASVIEVIALDEIGLLSRLTGLVAQAGYDITAARLTTLGEVAIDTFYVRSGDRPLSPEQLAELVGALNEVVSPA